MKGGLTRQICRQNPELAKEFQEVADEAHVFFLVPTFVPGRVHRVHIHIIYMYIYIYTHRYHIRIFTCVYIAWITRPKDQCRYIDSQM